MTTTPIDEIVEAIRRIEIGSAGNSNNLSTEADQAQTGAISAGNSRRNSLADAKERRRGWPAGAVFSYRSSCKR
jgi:hypothetical protein